MDSAIKIETNWFNIKCNIAKTIKIECLNIEEIPSKDKFDLISTFRKSYPQNIFIPNDQELFIIGEKVISNTFVKNITPSNNIYVISKILSHLFLKQFFDSSDFRVLKKKHIYTVIDLRKRLLSKNFSFFNIYQAYNIHFAPISINNEYHIGFSITTSLKEEVTSNRDFFINHGIKYDDLEFLENGICKTNSTSIRRIAKYYNCNEDLRKKKVELITNEKQFLLCKQFVSLFFQKKLLKFKYPLGLDVFQINNLKPKYNKSQAGILFKKLDIPKQYFYNNKELSSEGITRSKIEKNKPFSYDKLENKKIKIGVLSPEKYATHIATFFKHVLIELEKTYKIKKNQIFFNKYLIGSFELESYQEKITHINNVDLVLVLVSKSQINLPPSISPYYFCKQKLLERGINSQEIQIEQISSFLEKKKRQINDYKDHTISLNIYAKLGGIAWTIQQNAHYTNDLVFGIGGTVDKTGNPIIGLTSIFRIDGKYILGEAKSVVSIGEYKANLENVIKKAINKSLQEGIIQPKEKITLYFHIYKSIGKKNEIQAVLNALKNFPQLQIDYTFIHIGYGHNYHFHPFNKKNQYIDKHERGYFIQINSYLGFLSLKDKNPSYLKIEIDSRSTNKNLHVVANQIFSFSEMSHTSFKNQSVPITLKYPQLMAQMATKMSDIPGFFLRDIKMPNDSLWFL